MAEVSGDNHAAQLIRELIALEPDLIIEGIGGPAMAAAGANVHRNTVTRAAMGWRGLLRAGEVYRLLRWTARHFQTHRPDLLIGVDSPSMNFHFARIATERGIPTLQYVAPQLWAWAIWRMKKLRRYVDRVACILPFEEKFFRDHGVNATFVGHPIFDALPTRPPSDAPDRFPHCPPVIGLLAGSRKSEAEMNFPGMLAAAGRIVAQFPSATFLAPTTAATHPVVTRCIAAASTPLNIQTGLGRFDEMTPNCDLCITVSGTATLHVAAHGVPMIVVYYASPLTWNLAGRWLVPTRTFALVNVLAKAAAMADISSAGGHIVPEFVPWDRGPEVANIAIELLRDPQKLQNQRDALARVVATLDKPGASKNTARIALEMMDRGAMR